MQASNIMGYNLTRRVQVQSVTPKQKSYMVAGIILVFIVIITLPSFGVTMTDVTRYGLMVVNYLTPHLGWVFEAGAIIAGIFYLGYRHLNHRMLKVRCSNMLLVELDNVQTNADLIKYSYTPDTKSYPDLPRAIYDGLIISNNISYFDVDIQKKLHSLYANIHRYNIVAAESRRVRATSAPMSKTEYINRPMEVSNLKELITKLKDASDIVEKFRDRNEPRSIARFTAIVFSLLDKE